MKLSMSIQWRSMKKLQIQCRFMKKLKRSAPEFIVLMREYQQFTVGAVIPAGLMVAPHERPTKLTHVKAKWSPQVCKEALYIRGCVSILYSARCESSYPSIEGLTRLKQCTEMMRSSCVVLHGM